MMRILLWLAFVYIYILWVWSISSVNLCLFTCLSLSLCLFGSSYWMNWLYVFLFTCGTKLRNKRTKWKPQFNPFLVIKSKNDIDVHCAIATLYGLEPKDKMMWPAQVYNQNDSMYFNYQLLCANEWHLTVQHAASFFGSNQRLVKNVDYVYFIYIYMFCDLTYKSAATIMI